MTSFFSRSSFARAGVLFVVLLPVFGPAIVPFVQLTQHPEGLAVWQETSRLVGLAKNSVILIGGTLALAVPLGTVVAFLLFRTNLPGRSILTAGAIVALALPLPLILCGWQTVFGSSGWFSASWWSISSDVRTWTPWGQGLAAVIWIHSVAALPWVVVIVGQGLCWVEPELEEDSMLGRSALATFWRVTLRRSWMSVIAASLWVGVMTGNEIAVTDMMKVRTFAEEVYTQSIIPEGNRDAFGARMTATALPQIVLFMSVLLAGLGYWYRRLPNTLTRNHRKVTFALGHWRWLGFAVATLLVVGLPGVPLGSLVWRTGYQDATGDWSFARTLAECNLIMRAESKLLAASLVQAITVGVSLSLLALFVCAVIGRSRLGGGVVGLGSALLALPGPIVGLGVQESIQSVLNCTEMDWLESLLWRGPSLMPLIWGDSVRFFPIALLMIWPTYRMIPQEQWDLVQLESGSWRAKWSMVVWPMMLRDTMRAALLVSILALGEVSATKLLSTPGLPSYAENVFTQMHYGVVNSLAARCIIMTAVVLVGAIAFGLWSKRAHR